MVTDKRSPIGVTKECYISWNNHLLGHLLAVMFTALPCRQLWFRFIFLKHLNFIGDNFCEISHEATSSVSTRPQDGVVTRKLHSFCSNWVFEQTLHTIASETRSDLRGSWWQIPNLNNRKRHFFSPLLYWQISLLPINNCLMLLAISRSCSHLNTYLLLGEYPSIVVHLTMH